MVEMSEIKIKMLGVDVAEPRPGDTYLKQISRDANFSIPNRAASACFVLKRCGNDPSAGSPTETLLRLHLPLNDEV